MGDTDVIFSFFVGLDTTCVLLCITDLSLVIYINKFLIYLKL